MTVLKRTYCEFKQAPSNKHYFVVVAEDGIGGFKLYTAWGRIGSTAQEKFTTYGRSADALIEADRVISERTLKGYKVRDLGILSVGEVAKFRTLRAPAWFLQAVASTSKPATPPSRQKRTAANTPVPIQKKAKPAPKNGLGRRKAEWNF